MTQRRDVHDDDVGIRPSRIPRVGIPGPVTNPAPPPVRCTTLFELFRGGAGPVQLGRLDDGREAPRLVALRRLANLPTRELESAAKRAQDVSHPRLARLFGTYQHEDSWYVASEYIPGVTLFELGQTAVRQRTPVTPAVAVRIVLDALRVTADAAQLIEESTISARSLYPESLWISDSGELFLSELLVAPVLARTTTGASYVAVTAGMSAPALDARAAAVELARLACGRLMNGNPASWQTRELPEELSEILARAVVGGPGTESPAAFANALSALPPHFIATREEVQAEVERLTRAERERRQQQLESMRQPATDAESTQVFRAAPPAAVPEFAKSRTSTIPPDLAAARRARSSTVPPPKPTHVTSPSTNPAPKPTNAISRPTNPTPTIPAAPPTPPPAVNPADSPISGVWREAEAKLALPGQRTRRRMTTGEFEGMLPTTAPAAVPAPVAPITPPTAVAKPSSKRLVVVAAAVLALSALLGATWLIRGGSNGKPDTAQHAP